MSFEAKYLKYKSKYLSYKAIVGGSSESKDTLNSFIFSEGTFSQVIPNTANPEFVKFVEFEKTIPVDPAITLKATNFQPIVIAIADIFKDKNFEFKFKSFELQEIKEIDIKEGYYQEKVGEDEDEYEYDYDYDESDDDKDNEYDDGIVAHTINIINPITGENIEYYYKNTKTHIKEIKNTQRKINVYIATFQETNTNNNFCFPIIKRGETYYLPQYNISIYFTKYIRRIVRNLLKIILGINIPNDKGGEYDDETKLEYNESTLTKKLEAAIIKFSLKYKTNSNKNFLDYKLFLKDKEILSGILKDGELNKLI